MVWLSEEEWKEPGLRSGSDASVVTSCRYVTHSISAPRLGESRTGTAKLKTRTANLALVQLRRLRSDGLSG
jgi:hypothetical protein